MFKIIIYRTFIRVWWNSHHPGWVWLTTYQLQSRALSPVNQLSPSESVCPDIANGLWMSNLTQETFSKVNRQSIWKDEMKNFISLIFPKKSVVTWVLAQACLAEILFILHCWGSLCVKWILKVNTLYVVLFGVVHGNYTTFTSTDSTVLIW